MANENHGTESPIRPTATLVMDELTQRLIALEERLQPVLGPDSRVPKNTEEGPPSTSPLVANLQHNIGVIDSIHHRLEI